MNIAEVRYNFQQVHRWKFVKTLNISSRLYSTTRRLRVHRETNSILASLFQENQRLRKYTSVSPRIRYFDLPGPKDGIVSALFVNKPIFQCCFLCFLLLADIILQAL